MLKFLPTLMFALLLPTAIVAETPASAGDIATARSEASRLITLAHAEDLFTNITTGATARVRHNRSGLVCEFTPGAQDNAILIFDQAGTPIPRGDDVGCNAPQAGISHTLYATRYRPAMSARSALDQAIGAIQHRWPDARPYDGLTTDVSTDRNGAAALPRTLSGHYVVSIDGVDNYTSARIADYGGWIFMQRLTAPMDQATMGQLMAGMIWNAVLIDVVDHGQAI